jgi:hypothetical protein
VTYKITRVTHNKTCKLCTTEVVGLIWRVEQVAVRGSSQQEFHYPELTIQGPIHLGHDAIYFDGALVIDGTTNMPVLEKR